MKWMKFMLTASLIIPLLTGCGITTEELDTKLMTSPDKQTEFLLGTVVTVKIYDEGKEQVLETAFNRITELENKISAGKADSEIKQINDQAGMEQVPVSEDIYTLLSQGLDHSEKANGSFDVTIGPLTSLWHIGFDDAKKPEQAEIDAVLPLINYQAVELNEQEQTVFLSKESMKLDLGAIAKGFIADEVATVLKENDVTTAIIDLGGNIYVLGNHPSGNEWTVGIQDPFSKRGETVGTIQATNKSIVTSGIYERYLEVNGERYHHLLNPKDGYPFDNDIAGVSIISELSIDGDALSTVVFSKGIEEGTTYIENIEGVEAIFIGHERQVYLTSGLVDEFELTNEAFQLMD